MSDDDFWSSVYPRASHLDRPARFSALRLALLFGTATIAMAFILPPMIGSSPNGSELWASDPGIDYTTTASIRTQRTYTVQRSVLQSSADSVCIISARGHRSGEC